jgi:hypothetical protein
VTKLRFSRAALAAAATLLASTPASALYGGYEDGPRTFPMGKEYFLDEASFQPLPSMLDEWYEAELRPGGARGWRLACGSLNTFDGWIDQELKLEYPFRSPWGWSFRYEQGGRPSGRYERAWVGVRCRPESGWSFGLSITPDADKELADFSLAFGHELVAPEGDRVRLRWEARVVFPDNWYNQKNKEDASFDYKPLDLQLSVLGSWGGGSWVSLELDRDLPLRKTYGENPDLSPGDPDQNYVFSFENSDATVKGLFKFAGENMLLTRLVVRSADRGRVYFGAGSPADDWESDYDLWLASIEWWQRLDSRNELSFGYEFVDFDECTRRPDDTSDPDGDVTEDRMEHIVFVRHRRRLGEGLHLTTGLWNDFLDRVVWRSAIGREVVARNESKISFSLESSRTAEDAATRGDGPRSMRFVLGAFVELDAAGVGGYVQFTAIF